MEMDMNMERLKALSLSDPHSDRPSQFLLSPSSASSSPSGRLPIELLSEIFSLCVGGTIDKHHTICMPLLVSKICSRWRSAAIANHKLWSRLFLELELPNSLQPHPSSQKTMVETWLARSGACPLTIYVVWENPPFSFTHPVLDSLVEHCTRWHTMFLYLPISAFRSFSRIRNRLPILTQLSLGIDNGMAYKPGDDNKVDMFENAPLLRSLECISPNFFKFPWNQLQDIPLLAVTIGGALDILHRAKFLVTVGFMFVDLLPHTIPQRYIDHNHLRHFTLMTPPWNETVSLRPLFPLLAFSQLESLTLCNLRSPFGPEFTRFLSQLHVLKTLHLRRTALSDEQLVEGLKYLPSLTSLMVLDSQELETTVTRYLFSALTRNFFSSSSMDEDGMLLPRLTKLEMTLGSHVSLAALDSLLEMLQSRLREDGGVVKLQNVSLRSSANLDEEFLIQLIELRDFGLAVSVEGVGEHGMVIEELWSVSSRLHNFVSLTKCLVAIDYHRVQVAGLLHDVCLFSCSHSFYLVRHVYHYTLILCHVHVDRTLLRSSHLVVIILSVHPTQILISLYSSCCFLIPPAISMYVSHFRNITHFIPMH